MPIYLMYIWLYLLHLHWSLSVYFNTIDNSFFSLSIISTMCSLNMLNTDGEVLAWINWNRNLQERSFLLLSKIWKEVSNRITSATVMTIYTERSYNIKITYTDYIRWWWIVDFRRRGCNAFDIFFYETFVGSYIMHVRKDTHIYDKQDWIVSIQCNLDHLVLGVRCFLW